jgi:membrane dipeptidase
MRHFLLILSLFLSIQMAAQTEKEISAHADSLHKIMFSIDTHNDNAIWVNHPEAKDFSVTKGQVSFPMMKQGGLDAAVFAIFLDQKGRSEDSLKIATQLAVTEITNFKKYVRERDSEAELAFTPEDFLRIKGEGKSAVMLGIENGYALGKDISNVEMFYKMGVRVITICHNYDNDVCDASRYQRNEWGGLSPFGVEVIKQMNKLGIVIDVSHAATSTVFDCLQVSEDPIVATHSGVYAIKNHPRNLTDKEMIAIADKGGLVQIATGRFFLADLPKNQVRVKHLVDHIDYAKNLIGADHIGIGTDFDGGGGVVGLENVSKMKEITKEMIRRNYSDEEIKMFWGGNFLRVLSKIQK